MTSLRNSAKGSCSRRRSSWFRRRVRVSLLEAWIAYSLANEKLLADVVKFPVSEYMEKTAVTDDALKAYFEQNRDKYKIPDQLRYAFILARKSDLLSSVTVTNDEVTSYYNANARITACPRPWQCARYSSSAPCPIRQTRPRTLRAGRSRFWAGRRP